MKLWELRWAARELRIWETEIHRPTEFWNGYILENVHFEDKEEDGG